MNKLDETAVEYFDDTEHKAFLLDVIDVLERHHHTTKAKIDAADQKRGLVWNWINAHGYNVASKCPFIQTTVKTLNKKSSINFLDLIKGI